METRGAASNRHVGCGSQHEMVGGLSRHRRPTSVYRSKRAPGSGNSVRMRRKIELANVFQQDQHKSAPIALARPTEKRATRSGLSHPVCAL